MQTTRWVDKEENNLDKILNRILSFKEDSENETGEKNLVLKKVFEENQKINFNSREIIFNKINIKYDYIRAGNQPEEDRTTQKEFFILIYSTGINVNYIIDKNSDAPRLIRKLNGYTG